MNTTERKKMVAPCGIDCGICELYICKDNEQLFEYLKTVGIPEEKLPCPGCREIDGKCPVLPKTCATYQCITEKDVDFCYQCDGFPCNMLQPTVDRADTLPHNIKVFNLCRIEEFGLDSFVTESEEIKRRYFKGKMLIGEGPKI